MGRSSSPKLVNMLKRDRQRYKSLFKNNSRLFQQPTQKANARLHTKDFRKKKALTHKPRRPKKPNRMQPCEIQFAGVTHITEDGKPIMTNVRRHNQIYGKNLSRLGVYNDIVNKNRR